MKLTAELNRIVGEIKRYAWGEVNAPSQTIWFYSNSAEAITLSITNAAGMVVYSEKTTAEKGLNSFVYDYAISKEVADKWNKKRQENATESSE